MKVSLPCAAHYAVLTVPLFQSLTALDALERSAYAALMLSYAARPVHPVYPVYAADLHVMAARD